MGGTVTITPDAAPASPAQASPVTITPDQPTAEQTLSRTNANMTAALSGQPQSTPEDQAEFERGKKAGTIQGGVDIGTSVVLGPALTFLGMGGKAAAKAAPEVKQVGTGILDEFGNEMFRDVLPEAKQVAWKILQHPAVESAIKKVVKAGVVKSGAALAGSGLASWGITKLGDQLLHWLLSD